MNKLAWGEFEKIMKEACKAEKDIEGVIVFKQESFKKEYSEESRSYKVSSDAKYFNSNMIGNSLYGDSLDGADKGVRLDYYMEEIDNPWIVDYCYLV